LSIMKKSVIILLHLGYWFLYGCLLLLILMCLVIGTDLQTQPNLAEYRFGLMFLGFAVVPAVAGFYVFYGFLFSRFLSRKKIQSLVLAALVSAFLCGILGAMNLALLSAFRIGPGITTDGFLSALQITFLISIIALLNGGMGLLVRGFIRWYDELKLKEDLARKNFETELALVKSQLDPHFLFNTISNIDVLIAKDSERASAYLQKLSEIMRYMLYESKSEQIPLLEEWAYIEKYIALQKIRTSIGNYVDHSVEGNLANVRIAPMTLIPFVENAFKHAGRVKSADAIRIRLAVNGSSLVFVCENKYLPNDTSPTEPGGLGNELIEKRLALLYPERHQLAVQKNDELYRVHLAIDLHEN